MDSGNWRGIVYLLMMAAAAASVQAAAPDTLWMRTYGGAADDHCVGIRPAADGYVFAGTTHSLGAGEADYWLVKVDTTGGQVWQRTYGGIRWDSCAMLAERWNGEYLLIGSTRSFGEGGVDFWFVRTNDQGYSVWDRTYGELGNQTGRAICTASDDGYFLAGEDVPWLEQQSYLRVIKINSEGYPDWETGYGTTTMIYARGIRELEDGGCMVVGYETNLSGDSSSAVPLMVKLNSSGYVQSAMRYTDVYSSYVSTAVPTGEGGMLVAGWMSIFSHGEEGYWRESLLMKLNSNGASDWTVLCGWPYDDELIGAIPTLDGGAIGTGWRRAEGADHTNAFVVRVDNLGDTLWTMTFEGEQSSVASAALQLVDGGYLVGGTIEVPERGKDVWLMRFAAELDATPERAEFPQEIALYPNYPNPFNARTVIEYELPRASEIRLQVFDVLGRKIALLENGMASAGRHRVAFDANELPSGVYLCRLEAGNRSMVRKMVLLK